MREAMMVRRREDGSLDFDHYRVNAQAMRRTAMRDGVELGRFARFAGLTAAALCAMIMLAASLQRADAPLEARAPSAIALVSR